MHKPHEKIEAALTYPECKCHRTKRDKIPTLMAEFALNGKIQGPDDIPIFVSQRGSKKIICLGISPRDDLDALRSKIREALHLKLADR